MSEEAKTQTDECSQTIDYTSYPEGFEAALELLDFLPNDVERRRRFLLGLMDNLGRR